VLLLLFCDISVISFHNVAQVQHLLDVYGEMMLTTLENLEISGNLLILEKLGKSQGI